MTEAVGGGSAVFLGTYTPRLDDKGRLTLPARYRDELGEGLVITQSPDRSLKVYPRTTFERIAAQMQLGPLENDPERVKRTRVFFATASMENLDRQGRITVLPQLRQHAGLDRECVITGNNDHLEIWAQPVYEAYFAAGAEEAAGTSRGATVRAGDDAG